MRKIIIIVDAQNDFVKTPDEISCAEHIANYIDSVKKSEVPNFIVFTQDMHFDDAVYKSYIEGKNLPVHCVPDTNGFEVVDCLKPYFAMSIRKDTFASAQLANIIDFWCKENPDEEIEIEIMGFVTDICVVSNALLLRSVFPKVKITVYEDLCRGTSIEAHKAALQVMKSCFIEVK